MSISKSDSRLSPKAVSVRLEAHKFFVVLEDGREIGVPYQWFPRLASATPAQRGTWRLISKGTGIHWEAMDEDLSVAALLYPAHCDVEVFEEDLVTTEHLKSLRQVA